jgi:hypothetical protein
MDRGTPPDDDPDDGEDASADDEEQRDLQDQHASNGHVSDGSHVGYNLEQALGSDHGQEITPGVSVGDHTRCDRTRSHNNDPSLTTFFNDPPPQPPARGGRGRGKEVDGVEETLRAIVF